MGAWGAGSWDNDDALDWIPDLHAGGASAIRCALTEARDVGRSGIGACCRSLAAAEVVAAAFGCATSAMPDEAMSWAASGGDVGVDLVPLAIDVVSLVDSDSELQRLFDEAGRNEAWHAVTRGLLDRLAAIPMS